MNKKNCMDLFRVNTKRDKYTVIRPEHNKAVMEIMSVEEKRVCKGCCKISSINTYHVKDIF